MALGRRDRERQDELFICPQDLPQSEGHPFYDRLNELLAEAKFDEWLERRCAPYYANIMGRPSIPPGVYCRMILVGYFEGISSQRGIAWRCRDSLSLRSFLGVPLTESTPDHSSLTRTHKRLPEELHEEVFQFVLRIAGDHGLVTGKTVAVDSTTLEANAAMKSIVRRENGEDYQEFVRKLARDAGIENPTDDDLRRFDKSRKGKKVSNDEWVSATDPDSRIAKMKDGTTHLAYKAEHVIDVATELVVAATVHAADEGDAQTLVDSVLQAQMNVDAAAGHDWHDASDSDKAVNAEAVVAAGPTIDEAVADKGYHSAETIALAGELGVRTYICEPQRPHRRRWSDKPKGHERAVANNRRRMRGERGQRLRRQRCELAERSFAHVCETGGARRCWLHGLVKVTKRYLLQAVARNLGVILRKLFGVGTPRSLQAPAALCFLLHLAIAWLDTRIRRCQFVVRTLYAPTPHLPALSPSKLPHPQQTH